MNIHEIAQISPCRYPGTSIVQGCWRTMRGLWHGLAQVRVRRPRSLRLCESLSLGDRRFVAVIACEQSRFLLGGTSGSLVLLARLGSDSETPTELKSDAVVNAAEERKL